MEHVLFLLVGKVNGGTATRDAVFSDPTMRERYHWVVKELSLKYEKGIFLFNTWDWDEQGDPDRIFAYKPDEYVEHVVSVGRTDLIESVGERELRDWAKEYEKVAQRLPVRWLRPGTFINLD